MTFYNAPEQCKFLRYLKGRNSNFSSFPAYFPSQSAYTYLPVMFDNSDSVLAPRLTAVRALAGSESAGYTHGPREAGRFFTRSLQASNLVIVLSCMIFFLAFWSSFVDRVVVLYEQLLALRLL